MGVESGKNIWHRADRRVFSERARQLDRIPKAQADDFGPSGGRQVGASRAASH